MAEIIKINPDDFDRVNLLLKRLSGKDVAVALSRSINRSLNGIITDSTKIITSSLNIQAKVVRSSFKPIKASTSNLRAKVVSKGRPLNVVDSQTGKLRFKGKYKGNKEDQREGAYSFLFKKGHDRKYFPGAFRLKKAKFEGIFFRKKSASGKARSAGLKQIWTTRVPDMLENPEQLKVIYVNAGQRLIERLESQIGLLLR